LKYPECCIRAFLLESHCNRASQISWETAPCWSLLGIPILPHFPCCTTCEFSLRAARIRLAHIVQANETAEHTVKMSMLVDGDMVHWTVGSEAIAVGRSSEFFVPGVWTMDVRHCTFAVPVRLIDLCRPFEVHFQPELLQ